MLVFSGIRGATGSVDGRRVSVGPAVAGHIPALPLTLATDAERLGWAESQGSGRRGWRGGEGGVAFAGAGHAPQASFFANSFSPTGLLGGHRR